MKNTPLEIDKYGNSENGDLKKAHLAKKLWSCNFKIIFFNSRVIKLLIVGVQVLLIQQWFGRTLEAATGGVL